MQTTTGLAVEALRAGAAGRGTLFVHVALRIERYFRSLIPDRAEAEECMQRTLVVLEESLRERVYDPERSFNTWMWMKARTQYAQWCRERGRRMEPLPDEVARPVEALPIERRMDAHAVLTAVRESLGDECYEAFVLRYEGGLTLDEVARTLDRDRKTIGKRIDMAHRLIDRLLGNQAEGGS